MVSATSQFCRDMYKNFGSLVPQATKNFYIRHMITKWFRHFAKMAMTIVTFRRFWKARDAWLTNWLKWYSNAVKGTSQISDASDIAKKLALYENWYSRDDKKYATDTVNYVDLKFCEEWSPCCKARSPPGLNPVTCIRKTQNYLDTLSTDDLPESTGFGWLITRSGHDPSA